MVTIILVLTLVAMPVVGFIVYKQVTKSAEKINEGYDLSTNDASNRARDFVLFDDVKEGVLKLQGGHEYRICIECGSINWNLRTEEEQNTLEAQFLRFVNSLNYPIVFYVQTRTMDNSKIISSTIESAQKAVKQFPGLEAYANNYIDSIGYLDYYLQNNKQKKKYIIIPYDEAGMLANLNEAEKKERSISELYKRAEYVINRLGGMGISGKVLNSKEYIELIYASYHRTDYSDSTEITNGDYLSLMVESKRNPENNMTDSERTDWILYEAQNRIKGEIALNVMSDDKRHTYVEIINNLQYLRDQVQIME